MQGAFPPDEWFDAETYDLYRENVPLHVRTSSGRDVEVGTNGPDVIVWTPVTTAGTAALLALGLPGTVLGLAGLIAAVCGWGGEQRLPLVLGSLLAIGVSAVLLTGLFISRATRVTFEFDRSAGTLTARSRRHSTVVPLTAIDSVELIMGEPISSGGRLRYTYQLNLVFSGERPRRPGSTERHPQCRRRKNLSSCGDGEYLKARGQELAKLLGVHFVDAADPGEIERAGARALAALLPPQTKPIREG